jgi:hypothetical protein
VSDRAAYIAAVLTLYGELPDTPQQMSAADQWLAHRFHAEAVPLAVIEAALLLGSLRRLLRPADAPPLAPVRSLAYFRPVVEELRGHPAPDGYRDYLRLKLRKVGGAGSADVQISTFPDDR